jgi:hypothetical protein
MTGAGVSSMTPGPFCAGSGSQQRGKMKKTVLALLCRRCSHLPFLESASGGAGLGSGTGGISPYGGKHGP